MNIKRFVTDFLENNNYFFEYCGKKIMIDCGGTPEYTKAFISQYNFTPDYILLTHGHIDHILSLKLFENSASKVFISEGDREYLTSPQMNLSSEISPTPFIYEGDVFGFEDLPKELGIEVISTPGHSPGSVCFLCGDVLFSGDTLFFRNIGNTAFPGGDYMTEVNSIKKLLLLPEHITVYPGHGPSTTIGAEKRFF